MRILFYGGTLHGRVITVDILRPMEAWKVGKRGLHLDPDRPVSDFIDRYEPRLIRDSTYCYHSGRSYEQAAVMVCQGKTYNHRKVWRMMKRYKALPMHKVWVDSDPYSLV